jgi:hypothetical protein
MASPVCSLCGQRPRGKMASFYWAKFNGVSEREAWKQQYCKPCYVKEIEEWFTLMMSDHGFDGPSHCVQCDQADPTQLAALYLTAYVPNEPMERETVDICFEHGPTFLTLIQRGKTVLVDRQPEVAAPVGARW